MSYRDTEDFTKIIDRLPIVEPYNKRKIKKNNRRFDFINVIGMTGFPVIIMIYLLLMLAKIPVLSDLRHQICLCLFFISSIINFDLYQTGKREFSLLSILNILSYQELKNKVSEEQQKNPYPPAELDITECGGVVFGTHEGRVYGKPIEETSHCIVLGGTRSGKSSCIATPTAKSYHIHGYGGLIVDVKNEICNNAKIADAIIFNPEDDDAFGYNPFMFVRNDENLFTDINTIVHSLIPDGKTSDDYWIISSRRYLVSTLIYTYSYCHMSFIESMQYIRGTEVKKIFAAILASDCELAKRCCSDLFGLAEETLSGVVSNACNSIDLFSFDSYIIDALTKKQCISPEQIYIENKIIALAIPDYRIDTWSPVLRLLLNQFTLFFSMVPIEKAKPVLFLIDEFYKIGRLDSIIAAASLLANRKICICCLTQSLSQIDLLYQEDGRRSFFDNMNCKIFLNASDSQTEKYISELIGNYDKREKSTTYNNTHSRNESGSKSYSYKSVPIIEPDKLAYNQNVLCVSSYGFFKLTKKPYYID